MKQHEIKIPLKCNTILRILGVGFVIGINYFLYLVMLDPTIESMIPLNIILAIVWGEFEFSNYMCNCIDKDKPIFPFTFKCKCDKENND